MSSWIEVSEARERAGLRIALTKRIPNPWAESAKGLFLVKKVPFARVAQRPGLANEELQAWTGQRSAPVVAWNDERPRTGWSDIILLAERIAPEPRLIPRDAERRARMFGLVHELAAERGFGWTRRMMFALSSLEGPDAMVGEFITAAYGSGRPDMGELGARVAELLDLFAGVLQRQLDAGRRYFLGDELTALDIYWAGFAALIEPLPHDLCPMLPLFRGLYTLDDPELRARVAPTLMEHRDRIYREHLQLPVQVA
jgi:glutathione S-transferase